MFKVQYPNTFNSYGYILVIKAQSFNHLRNVREFYDPMPNP